MNKPFVIRDPVHGYLEIAAYERIVIDHPITQRLRRITQTGLAEFVFPEARTSRFIHSLGAMHLASQYLIGCIENADELVARNFFSEIENLDVFQNYSIKLEELDCIISSDRGSGGGGLRAAKVSFRDKSLRSDPKFVRLLGLVEAGLRLAALFHDLGHLPFSHDFEYALKDFAAESTEFGQELQLLATGVPHEKIGHRLADLVFQALIDQQTGIDPGTRAAFAMARKILDNDAKYDDFPVPNVDALGWLHSLIDGEIDVDRADYLLRDARALGLEFASYDLTRLISNLVLVKHRTYGYITAVDERGLTSVESFYISRARSSQILIRHHKTAQLGGALRYASVRALGSIAGKAFIVELLKLTGAKNAKEANELLTDFSRHDDPWWLEVLRSYRPSKPTAPLTLPSIDLVLRRSPSFVSLWKRKGNIEAHDLKALNSALRSSEYQTHFARARKQLAQKGVLLVLHKFEPYGVKLNGSPERDSITLIRSGKTLTPIVRISPLIRALRTAWNEDLHLHAFAVDGTITKEEVLAVLLRPTGSKKRPKSAKQKVSRPSVQKRTSKRSKTPRGH